MQRDEPNHRMLCFVFNQQQQHLSSLSNNTALDLDNNCQSLDGYFGNGADTLLSMHQLFSSF